MFLRNSTTLVVVLLTSGLGNAVSATKIDCNGVVEDTLVEMKAGASGWWDEDTARMAGMAAASACFKAKAISTSSDHESDGSQVDVIEQPTDFMGLRVKPLSGPPSRKPYERRDRD